MLLLKSADTILCILKHFIMPCSRSAGAWHKYEAQEVELGTKQVTVNLQYTVSDYYLQIKLSFRVNQRPYQ